MKFRFIALYICLVSALGACRSSSDFPELPVAQPAPQVADRTVLVYLLADNSLSSFADIDLDEMLEGIKNVDTRKNNLIVYMDRRGGGDSHLMRVCRNTQEEIITDTIQSYDSSINSVSVHEMERVFTYVSDHFPARSTGLVVWSHGDGWIPYDNPKSRWIGQDTNNGKVDNRLNIDELHTVLKSVSPFDFLLFDACYMQSIEVAYELRDCAAYFIGSPTEIPGPGAPYQDVVPALFAASEPELKVASAYYDYYAKKYNGGSGISNSNWTGGVSISVIQSEQLDNLAAATKALSIYTQPNVDLSKLLCYDSLRDRNYYDMEQRIKAVASSPVSFEDWKASYSAAVIYEQTTPGNYNTYNSGYGTMVPMTGYTGVSISIPSRNAGYLPFYEKLLWYIDTKAN